MVNARPSDSFIIGLLLVALGVMFLLDTTSALGSDTAIVGTYWPALLIAWALWRLMGRGLALRLWSLLLLVVGVVFLLSNLNLWAWEISQLWPILLVLAGLALVFGGRLRPRRRTRWRGRRVPGDPRRAGTRGNGGPAGRAADGPGQDFRAFHIFGGGKEQVTAQDFQGGEVSAIFGGMELDLRDATLAAGGAVLDANVVCGGLQLRVPRDWRVNIQTSTLLGAVENKRSQPNPGDVKGELTITGAVLCGAIEVKD